MYLLAPTLVPHAAPTPLGGLVNFGKVVVGLGVGLVVALVVVLGLGLGGSAEISQGVLPRGQRSSVVSAPVYPQVYCLAPARAD